MHYNNDNKTGIARNTLPTVQTFYVLNDVDFIRYGVHAILVKVDIPGASPKFIFSIRTNHRLAR